ncbi:segregation/condensation protein A, partial [Limosilactobacillus mucosae]|nr:segregation/condensation protein A [Limosilactobacillus mucosae]
LKDKEAFRQKEFTRTAMAVPAEFIHSQTAPGTTLEQLKEAFEQVLKRHQALEPETATVAPEKTTVEERIQFVMQRVRQGAVAFEELFEDLKTRDNLVTTFLAVLELAKHRRVVLHQA